MSDRFRELLRKVGSGQHTSESLSRQDAADAARMMLTQEATPAQIGAFMIAHRIRRPTGEELAGMLDAYKELGQQLSPINAPYRPVVMNSPYDGRSRTAPISPITSLILATAGCPTVLHGGMRMPTKYGLPFVEIWQGLGLNWAGLSMAQVQSVFEKTRLGFVYLPDQFPLAQGLVPYRDQLGKRPPQATLELMWSPYRGDALVICGFVHPPTEQMIQEALTSHGVSSFITIKGLEGSCDLPRDRTCIIGLFTTSESTSVDSLGEPQSEMKRLLLHPKDYGFEGKDVALDADAAYLDKVRSVLQGQSSELMQSAIWNGGFYLWQAGVCESLEAGLTRAEAMLTQGHAAQQLDQVKTALAEVRSPMVSR
ncbi:MAG: anthranilate phosphoribosyltransferase family protein [Elainellaceae cyanobacterium]